MKKVGAFLGFAVSLLWLCASAVASSEYVIVNNGNAISNSAFLYKLNTKTGKLAKTGVLHTGGQAYGPLYVFQVQQAVAPEASCIFVLDTGSSDIAVFSRSSGYKRVGSYFRAELIAGEYGGGLALAATGKFLYAVYDGTGNIGLWSVNSDCTLVFVAEYGTGGITGPIKITPNGKYLVVSDTSGALLYAISKADGGLTDLGAVNFSGGACARVGECLPHGIDITKDSKFAVFASNAVDVTRQHSIAVALTARITPAGLVHPRVWVLKNSATLAAAIFPFFSAAGYAGSGDLYFGVEGGGAGYSPGVLTTHFTESPMSFEVTNATVVDPDVGNIAVTGNLMVVAQPPNQIGVFRIKKDGSLKLLSTTTVDGQGEGLFSLSIFPNTR
jgi:hypothetical protein